MKNKDIKYYLFEDTVGNGGFSLRKTKAILNAIDFFEKNGKIDRYRNTAEGYLQEDIFFGFEAKKKLRIPSYKKAALFAVEDFPKWYTTDNDIRSFGCHAWTKEYYIDGWLQAIEEWGYKVNKEYAKK